MGKRTWTESQILQLLQQYPTTPTNLLAKEFNKTKKAVASKAKLMGLKKKIALNNPYTEEKLKYLIENYSDTKNVDLAKKLGVSESSVNAKAFKLKLRKSEDFKERHRLKGKFKKGHVPSNKGKKQTEYMSAESIEKTKATRFKKGGISANRYEDFTEVIREDKNGKPYIMIRTPSKGKLSYKHIYIWEKENGKVPKGHCLWFIDGNTMNCKLENLELITRAENLKRNVHNRPKEFNRAIKLKNKILKQINNGS